MVIVIFLLQMQQNDKDKDRIPFNIHAVLFAPPVLFKVVYPCAHFVQLNIPVFS